MSYICSNVVGMDRERRYALQALHRHRNFGRMIEYLRTHPCVDCGEADLVVLELDHLPEFEKKFEVSRAVGSSTRSWNSISSGIEKCEVVCANCHRRRGARRGGFRRHLLDSGETIPEPAPLPRERIPHGGGAKGRTGCLCEPCLLQRRWYAREFARRKAVRRRTDESAVPGTLDEDPQ